MAQVGLVLLYRIQDALLEMDLILVFSVRVRKKNIEVQGNNPVFFFLPLFNFCSTCHCDQCNSIFSTNVSNVSRKSEETVPFRTLRTPAERSSFWRGGDSLDGIHACHAMPCKFRDHGWFQSCRFTRNAKFTADELLETAATFKAKKLIGKGSKWWEERCLGRVDTLESFNFFCWRCYYEPWIRASYTPLLEALNRH